LGAEIFEKVFPGCDRPLPQRTARQSRPDRTHFDAFLSLFLIVQTTKILLSSEAAGTIRRLRPPVHGPDRVNQARS
jgi:hypothetical protein